MGGLERTRPGHPERGRRTKPGILVPGQNLFVRNPDRKPLWRAARHEPLAIQRRASRAGWAVASMTRKKPQSHEGSPRARETGAPKVPGRAGRTIYRRPRVRSHSPRCRRAPKTRGSGTGRGGSTRGPVPPRPFDNGHVGHHFSRWAKPAYLRPMARKGAQTAKF